MTDYDNTKKLSDIPPWPVHSHTWLCLHDFQGRVNQASSRSSGNIQIWRFHSADYISRRTALGAIVVPRPVRKKKLRTWRVIRLPAAFIGLVEAPDEQTALKVAIEQFKISPADQWRRVAVLTAGLLNQWTALSFSNVWPKPRSRSPTGRTKWRSNAGSSPNLKSMEARLPMPNIC